MVSVLGNVPKCLAPLWGKTFICHQLDWLLDQGLTGRGVTLCLGKGAEEVIKATFTYKKRIPHLSHYYDPDMSGTGGSLLKAVEHIDYPVLVLNGDTLFDFNTRDVIKWHGIWGSRFTVVVESSRKKIENGHTYVFSHRVKPDNRTGFKVESLFFSNNVEDSDEDNFAELAGAYVVEPPVLRAVASGKCNLDKDVLSSLLQNDVACYAYEKNVAFHDIGTPGRYEYAEIHRNVLHLFEEKKTVSKSV